MWPSLPLIACGCWLEPRFPENHGLVDDWYAHAVYLTLFLYGYLLGRPGSGAWAVLSTRRWQASALALGCFMPWLFLDKFAGHIHWLGVLPSVPWIAYWIWLCLHYLYTWAAICALLGWAGHALNRPFRWLPYAREAVYPWYVLHQSLLLLLAHWLLPLRLGSVLEPILILGGTIAGCALIHEYGIRRWSMIRPLFGLPALRQHRRDPEPEQA